MDSKKFVKSWKSSTLPHKQRKYRYNAPLHIRVKFVNAPLSKELTKKHNMARISVRKGDTVKLLRGQFKNKTGKVNRVNLKTSRIYIDGIETTKKDGNKTFYPVHPSNVMIIDLVLDDKTRIKAKTKRVVEGKK